MLQITALPAFKDNYIWIIGEQGNPNVAVVDPGDAGPVLTYLAQHQLQLCAVLITHHHRDHIGGLHTLLQHFSFPVYGPANESIAQVSHPCHHGEVISLPTMAAQFQIIATPGHTHGHLCYYGHGALFCGDTLFTGGCGRLFEGTPAQMQHSLSLLRALPDATQVYCAHEYTEDNLTFAQLAEPGNTLILQRLEETKKQRNVAKPTVPSLLSVEKQTNPFLRWDATELISNAELFAGHTLTTPAAVLGAVRHWKDTID